jgi:hypothetical protein
MFKNVPKNPVIVKSADDAVVSLIYKTDTGYYTKSAWTLFCRAMRNDFIRNNGCDPRGNESIHGRVRHSYKKNSIPELYVDGKWFSQGAMSRALKKYL